MTDQHTGTPSLPETARRYRRLVGSLLFSLPVFAAIAGYCCCIVYPDCSRRLLQLTAGAAARFN